MVSHINIKEGRDDMAEAMLDTTGQLKRIADNLARGVDLMMDMKRAAGFSLPID